LSATSDWTVESNQADAYFGESVSTAGDVNGDGFADVIVGALYYDNDETNEGRAFVYHGSASGLSEVESWTAESNQINAYFGESVSTAGDVNGDGYADVIVGSSAYNNGESGEGRAFVYYGNEGPGLSLRPEQRRVADTAPIPPLGVSDSADSFRLKLLGRTPFGRGEVKLEWENKPFGSPLNGIDTKVTTHYHDTDTSGVGLSEVETGLIDGALYHWRVRMRYHPVTTPFAQRSRWLTVPWGGCQEADLRTGGPAAAGRVPHQAGWPGQPLMLGKTGGSDLTLTWDVSCMDTDTDYAVYEGELGNFYSHGWRHCSTGGATTTTITPQPGDRYYLVVPLNSYREGSYGTWGAGIERPQGVGACLPQQIGACD
jgi:hypothetical protein